ncbi:MAG TPA: hypothetical protein VIK18_02760, partial [Pirellulales bacterium]
RSYFSVDPQALGCQIASDLLQAGANTAGNFRGNISITLACRETAFLPGIFSCRPPARLEQ